MKRILHFIISIGISLGVLLFNPLESYAEYYRREYKSARDAERSKIVGNALDLAEQSLNKTKISIDAAPGHSLTLKDASAESLDTPVPFPASPPPNRYRESGRVETTKRQSPYTLKRSTIVNQTLDQLEFDFNVSTGLRFDELQWQIAGNSSGMNPNILSELRWDNLWSYQIGTEAKVVWNKRLRVEGSFDIGWLYSGDNQDSDFVFDNKFGEISRSNNVTEDDNVVDTSIGVGYQFQWNTPNQWKDFLTDEVDVTLLTGYSYHEQNLRITDGFQVIPALGEFPGLNSTYFAEWDGPWVGIELAGERKGFRGFGRLEYHWADYYAEANWNLRGDFQHPISFVHDTDGTGVVFSLGGEMIINDNWSAGLKATIQRWEADSGLDRTFFSNGTTIDTQLRGVEWDSYAVMLSASYQFGGSKKKLAIK